MGGRIGIFLAYWWLARAFGVEHSGSGRDLDLPPDYMTEQVQSYLQGDGYNATDSLWSVDALGGFTISTTEG